MSDEDNVLAQIDAVMSNGGEPTLLETVREMLAGHSRRLLNVFMQSNTPEFINGYIISPEDLNLIQIELSLLKSRIEDAIINYMLREAREGHKANMEFMHTIRDLITEGKLKLEQ